MKINANESNNKNISPHAQEAKLLFLSKEMKVPLPEPSHAAGNGHWQGLFDSRSVCSKTSSLKFFSFDLVILFLEPILRNVI